MGGQNPYLHDQQSRLPGQKYEIVIVDETGKEHVIDVDPAKLPFGDHGLPGSILDICLGHGIELDHACGGVCACATCHVQVLDGLPSCGEASEEEENGDDSIHLDAAHAAEYVLNHGGATSGPGRAQRVWPRRCL